MNPGKIKIHRRAALQMGAAAWLAGTASLSRAAAWPERPIKLILPFAVGGTADSVARLLAGKLTERLGQPVIIEPRLGANGLIAADFVAKAAPDGYTLLINSSAQVINPSLYEKLPFDAAKAFAPIAQVVAPGPFVIVVHPSVPARNLQELIAWAKANPQALSYGSGGIGNSLHLGGEMLAQAADIRMLHVPYKGAAPIVNDLLGGQIKLMFNSWLAVAPFVKDGKLRAIAQTGLSRSVAMPDIPTVAESGLTGFDFTSWYGLYAPAGTPREVILQLNGLTRWAMSQSDVLARLAPLGSGVPQALSPEEFAQFNQTETQRYGRVIKAARISMEPGS